MVYLDLEFNLIYDCPEYGDYSNFDYCYMMDIAYCGCTNFPTGCEPHDTIDCEPTALVRMHAPDVCDFSDPCGVYTGDTGCLSFLKCKQIDNVGYQVIEISIDGDDGYPELPDLYNIYRYLECFTFLNGPEDVFPTELALSPYIKYLDFDGSYLYGSLPTSLGPNLYYLNLHYNSFDGEIPSSFASPALQYLDLSENFISGTIPLSLGLYDIKYLNLMNNFLYGEVPNTIMTSTTIQVLKINDNYVRGCFNWTTVLPSLTPSLLNPKTGDELGPSNAERNCFYVDCNYYSEQIYNDTIPVGFFNFNCENQCAIGYYASADTCVCPDGQELSFPDPNKNDLQTCTCPVGFSPTSSGCVEAGCCPTYPDTAVCDDCKCLLDDSICCSQIEWFWSTPPPTNDTRFIGMDEAIEHTVRLWSALIAFPNPSFRIKISFSLKVIRVNPVFNPVAFTEVTQTKLSDYDIAVPPAFNDYYTEANTPGLVHFNITINADYEFDYHCGLTSDPKKYNLVTVLMHEIAHGLMMYTELNDDGTYGFINSTSGPIPGLWDLFLSYDNKNTGEYYLPVLNATENGFSVVDLNALKKSGTQFYLPIDDYDIYLNRGGVNLSYSDFIHLDSKLYPSNSVNSLMTPTLQLGEVQHYPGYLVLSLLNYFYSIDQNVFCSDIDNEHDCQSANFLGIPNICGWCEDHESPCGPGCPVDDRCYARVTLFIKDLPPNLQGVEIYYTSSDFGYETVQLNGGYSITVDNYFRDGDELYWVFYDPMTNQYITSDLLTISGCYGVFGLQYPQLKKTTITLFNFVDCNNDGLYDDDTEPPLLDQVFSVYSMDQYEYYSVLENGTLSTNFLDHYNISFLIGDSKLFTLVEKKHTNEDGVAQFNIELPGVYIFLKNNSVTPLPSQVLPNGKKMAEKEAFNYQATFDNGFKPSLKQTVPIAVGGYQYYYVYYTPGFSYSPIFGFGDSPGDYKTYLYYNCPRITGLPVTPPIVPPSSTFPPSEKSQPVSPSDFPLPPTAPPTVGLTDPPTVPIQILNRCTNSTCPTIEVIAFKRDKFASYSASPCVGITCSYSTAPVLPTPRPTPVLPTPRPTPRPTPTPKV
eukprot:TRINITY_DN7077_c0_g3_i6.p1 TRINITY_DN7077_c0_g3~~TRINITY_DN7077_c0_g3_i6.p1  ORF type:complete len:1091 (-),score=175.46 TRINITY_DN7077_c0_g3_i6:51-3323(-)